MILNNKQEELFEFVKEKHKGQVRKYTGEPYHNHLYNVAEIVSNLGEEYIEVALCHDLFEDTDCGYEELFNKLFSIGYDENSAFNIRYSALELTDEFTKENFPDMNRENRKIHEAIRLSNISEFAQTVKYADLIDNTKSIVECDKQFSKVYLKEKRFILSIMDKGNKQLYNKAKLLCN